MVDRTVNTSNSCLVISKSAPIEVNAEEASLHCSH